MAYSCHKSKYMLIFVVLLISMSISITTSYDPKKPPKLVHEVCHRCGPQLYWYCIAVFNTGSVEEGVDMKFLSYYTRDFADNNATYTLDQIDKTFIPYHPDPYIQEVLLACKDAFGKLKDELENRINAMLVQSNTFEEAKVWVNYGIGLMDSCRDVCKAKPNVACLLEKDITDTHGILKILAVVLQLLTEGVN